MSSLDHIWAAWRHEYITSVVHDPVAIRPDASGSLFERILALSDEEGYVVHRGQRCSTILNAYPYANGHLLVLPNRPVEDLTELTPEENVELWGQVRDGVGALRSAYRAEGVNVGANLGAAGGAGVPDHLHVHVVPRWKGDTNFMTAIANTRVLPETMEDTWRRLRDAWPS